MGRWGLAAVVIVPIVLRALALRELGDGIEWIDLRGAAADMAIGAVLWMVLLALIRADKRVARVLAAIVAVLWILAHVGLYEFIYAHGSVYAFDHLHFLGDSTFLMGSAANLRHPILMLVGVLLVIWGARGRPTRVDLIASSGVAVVCIVGLLLSSVAPDRAEWRQRNSVVANLAGLFGRGNTHQAPVDSKVVDAAYTLDLSGEPWWTIGDAQPNILWILLEGVSGAHLPSVAEAHGIRRKGVTMPALDTLAKSNVLFPRVISHQRQTNRGEYAIFCGDYPKLRSGESKMTETVRTGERRCLPAALRERGYETVYIQAAPLSFMLKDQFMSLIGFDRQIGDEAFDAAYARTAWGVDDKAFFEQALPMIVDLRARERPFFAAMLTVGTHHPYTFPRDYKPKAARSRAARAFRWADEALGSFVASLREAGVLEDTVVLFTSDESAGVGTRRASTYVFSQHWSFAVLMLPGVEGRQIDDVFEHVDLAASFADLVGADAKGFLGRSLFRTYETGSPAFFGNVYTKKSMMWTPDDRFVVCDEQATECAAVKLKDNQWGRPGSPSELTSADRDAVLGAIQRAEARSNEIAPGQKMRLTDRETLTLRKGDERALVFGGQYLTVPAGSRVRVELEIEVEGGTADLHHDAFAKGHPIIERRGIAVNPGQTLHLAWEANYPNGTHSLVVQLYAGAKTRTPTKMTIRTATLELLQSNGLREQVQVTTEKFVASP